MITIRVKDLSVASDSNRPYLQTVGLTMVLSVWISSGVVAQYAPPPPPEPFAGFLNESLRKDNPYMNQWDLSGAARFRYEVREGFAIPGVAGSLDFRNHGADVDNEYLLD